MDKARRVVIVFIVPLELNIGEQRFDRGVEWYAPMFPFIKINIDVGFDAATRATTLGVVIRDSSGLVLVSAVNKLGKAANALYAKILGI